MAKSAPEVSFSVTSINFGTIDVGASCAKSRYSVYEQVNSTTHANAINMSISFKESTNASEARKESWVVVSTPTESVGIESVGGNEAYVGSLVAKAESVKIAAKVEIPAGAVTAGRVAFYLHHRACAAIRRMRGSISTQDRKAILSAFAGGLTVQLQL